MPDPFENARTVQQVQARLQRFRDNGQADEITELQANLRILDIRTRERMQQERVSGSAC
jgi:hypothetical protein